MDTLHHHHHVELPSPDSSWAAASSLKLPMLSPLSDIMLPTEPVMDILHSLYQQGYDVDMGPGGVILSSPVGGLGPAKAGLLLSNLITPPRTPPGRSPTKSSVSWTPINRSKWPVPPPLDRGMMPHGSSNRSFQKSLSCPSTPLSKHTGDTLMISKSHSPRPQHTVSRPVFPDDNPDLHHTCVTHVVATPGAKADPAGDRLTGIPHHPEPPPVRASPLPADHTTPLSPSAPIPTVDTSPSPESRPLSRQRTPLSRSRWSSLPPEARLNLSDLAPRRPPTASGAAADVSPHSPARSRPVTAAGVSPPRTPLLPARRGCYHKEAERYQDDCQDRDTGDGRGGAPDGHADVLSVQGSSQSDRPSTASSAGSSHPGYHKRVPKVPRVSRANMLQVFDCLDVDKNGKITMAEFEEGAVSLGFSEGQAQRMFHRLDLKGHGFLEAYDWGRKDLSNIVKAFTQMYMQRHMGLPDCNSSPDKIRDYLKKQKVLEVKSLPAAVQMCRMTALVRGSHRASGGSNPIFEAFRFMDSDGSGDLTKEEIRDAFSALGVVLSETVADQIMVVFDADGNGTVNYYEFVRTMFPRVGAAMR